MTKQVQKYWVIDTNILVSSLLNVNGNESKALLKARESGIILVSEELKDEYLRVLTKKKFDKYILQELRLAFFDIICEEAVSFETFNKIDICRDPKDNMLLEIAFEAKADAIITGDRDLLVLHPFAGIPIVSSVDFMKLF